MNLHKLLLKNNNCYKAGVKMTPKGLMLHSTGAKNKTLKRYVGPDDGLLGHNSNGNHWNTAKPEGISACVHGFIGELADGTVATYQTLPWERGDCYRGWHAGKAAGNDGYIGVEICEDGLADPVYFGKAYQETVELNAYLCIMHGLNPLTDIICHSEGYKKGIATNHGDVMHWFPKHGKNMDTFRADVKAAMGSTGTANANTGMPASTGASNVTACIKNSRTGLYQRAMNTSYKTGLAIDDSCGPLSIKAAQAHNLRHTPGKTQIHNAYVRFVQQALKDLGYAITADGYYGPKTAAAVKQFQAANGLTADGVVGSGTLVMLLKKFN